VHNGKPTPKYVVALEDIGTEHSDAHLHLPGNQSNWEIFMTYAGDEPDGTSDEHAALHIGRVTLTVERPDVVAAQAPIVSERGMLSWSPVVNSGQIIRQEGKLQMSFHFLCRKIGESRVLITIPVLQYDTLEFGLAKECTHVGTSRKSHELMLTTNNILWGFTIILAGAVVAACIRRRSKGNVGFVQVSTQEV